MSEHAKDMAIEITPKTETPPVRLPRIVAEINRVASRVRERKKKEEEDNDDAEVLENDAPTPSLLFYFKPNGDQSDGGVTICP